ncbi:MAG: outer membrane protein transport protein [Pseudomonadota bacterium]
MRPDTAPHPDTDNDSEAAARCAGLLAPAMAAPLLLIPMLLPGQAHAGAFQINERSAKSQGLSYADSVSGAKDPTYAGFNPAALATVQGLEIAGNASGIFPIADGSTTSLVIDGMPAPAAPPGVATETNADRSGFVPASAIGYRIDDQFVVGFTLKTPFGLATENPDTFIGAGDGIQSSLVTIEASPAIAYEVTDRLALGFAFNIIVIDARLTNSLLTLDGVDYEFGFSAGALWEPIDGTRIGLAYHHSYDADISGEAIFSPAGGDVVGPLAGRAFDTEVNAGLPSTVQIGITQDLTDDLRISVEGRYIRWSVFDAITTTIDAVGFEAADPQNYEDAFFVAAGAEYDVNDRLTIRGGVAYDDSPTVDTTSLTEAGLGRTVRVPDADRLWLSTGFSYDLPPLFGLDTTLDASYSYLLALEDPEVVIRSGPFAGSTVEYDGGAHIFSVGGSVRF